ncbi:MAG: 3-deoxy-7-phosphoheptulonate synthase [Ruminococcaceae bacterium]|nr:3-deoxy-7-phosphoheptulonate synthase [Oscillospiraceae bacterium]
MVIVLKNNYDQVQLDKLTAWIREMKIEPHFTHGESQTIMGLVGDTSKIDIDMLGALDIVESIKRVSEPYKQANRKFHPEDTIITLENGAKIGGGNLMVMAGPCSIESEEQLTEIAMAVKKSGANVLRGGAFKPRTSPYAFQGMREDGLALLIKVKEKTGLPVVTEIMDYEHLPYFKDVDIIQVGARNMQNFELLKHLGRCDKPILLKRGLSNTLEELLMSAEYIMSEGNEKVILCERGIRTFETATRNTLDISAVPLLHQMTHLPVVVDPSHATGKAALVPSMALAGIVAGTDGLIIEVHNNPQKALCDGAQSLTPAQFDELAGKIAGVKAVAYR